MQPFKQILGNFLERYKQLSMVRAIGDQVEKNPEGKYSLEFIVDGDSSKNLRGFALSESKAHELKEKLLNIFRGEASYEIS